MALFDILVGFSRQFRFSSFLDGNFEGFVGIVNRIVLRLDYVIERNAKEFTTYCYTVILLTCIALSLGGLFLTLIMCLQKFPLLITICTCYPISLGTLISRLANPRSADGDQEGNEDNDNEDEGEEVDPDISVPDHSTNASVPEDMTGTLRPEEIPNSSVSENIDETSYLLAAKKPYSLHSGLFLSTKDEAGSRIVGNGRDNAALRGRPSPIPTL
ncbi:uncharacterized protein LOC108095280 [Drosophila ficusphila]|uniref:uncharacterized protein LOC108095280 n=1 Tax=Drosophila ficusphila TaxID=30025 RepID=UPI0007E7CE9D|nr:uncharacterized protein LOC108095280 [Drosophila ficusphila]